MHPPFLQIATPASEWRLLRNLLLDPATHPRGQPHLSAASGLVRLGRHWCVVADDELHLGLFDAEAPARPGSLLRLLEGALPDDKALRKKAKPDFETLTLLPALPGYPTGALLAMGSGSAPQRQTGVLLALDTQGLPDAGRITRVDLAPLYAPLRQHFADLNIEGALVLGDHFVLLQRGNQRDARSACVRYAWPEVAAWLLAERALPPAASDVQTLALGEVAGVPLTWTDGTALADGAWAFSAVAESTDNSYQDGACVGSAVGVVGPDGRVRQLQLLAGAPKVEGIAAQAVGDDWLITLVTDPDDPQVASQMLQLQIAQP